MRIAGATRTPRSVVLFFALLCVPFTCVFPYMATLNNPDENVRVYMTMAIVEFHTFRIDKIVERHGWVNDMARAPDPRTQEPHYYSIKGPATGYAAVPFYWAFTKLAPRFGHPVPTTASTPAENAWWLRASVFVTRFFVVQLPCFVFLIWLERWLRRVSADTVLRLCAISAVGIGTNYLAYSLMFVSHTLFAVAAFPAFALITSERLRFSDPRRRRLSRAFLAGVFAGLASLLEYHAFPISCLLALYAATAFWRPTRLIAFSVGGLLNAAALMFYQWRCYNNPLTPGHKMAENPLFASWHKQGFFGLGVPSWQVFRDLSISPTFGFFSLSPFMVLGALAIPFAIFSRAGSRAERSIRRTATIAWILFMLALWLPISGAVNWRGGWTVGPRFFGAAPPFFAFGALCGLEWIARRGPFARALTRGVAGGLMLAGVLQVGLLALEFNTYPEDATRPLAQVAIPLARAGFVPHHLGELFGWGSRYGWYIAAGALALSALFSALLPRISAVPPRARAWRAYAVRVGVVIALFWFGIRPSFSAPRPEEGGDGGVSARSGFARGWEPAGRDRISQLRVEAERDGVKRPCLWFKLSDLERSVSWDAEAVRDEKRADATPRSACR